MSHPLFGANLGDRLLLECFSLAHTDPCDELVRFLPKLEGVNLPFSLVSQIRKVEYPGYPGFECGLPSLFHYFVPNSNWGSDCQRPLDPLDLNAVYCTDGFGLNLGCPLRLKKSIELLLRLPQPTASDCWRDLSLPAKHLDTVEEVLWADIWTTDAVVERSENTANRTHDWKVTFSDKLTIRQECKLRKAIWPRLADGPDFQPLPGFLLEKASKQLPKPPENQSINLVSITGLADLDEDMQRLICLELEKHQNVEALVYRGFTGDMTVFSLSERVAEEVCSRITPRGSPEFQPFYYITDDRSERERRRLAKGANPTPSAEKPNSKLFSRAVPNRPPNRHFSAPIKPYRKKLINRSPNGEPIFEVVSPYLKKL